MPTYVFDQYWGYANADVACRECGRISKRNIREYCTVNPFNKNEAGEVRGPEEVRQQARAAAEREAARQVERGRICRKCEAAKAEVRAPNPPIPTTKTAEEHSEEQP